MENLIKKALEVGNIDKAKKLTTAKFQQEDKQAWDKARSDEYELLFPKYRVMTDAEKAVYKSELKEEGYTDEELNDLEYDDYPPKVVSYSEDETYVTYTDWLNETKVVSEAVQEVSTTDNYGMKTITTPYQAEVTELVRPYIASDVSERVETYPAIVEKLNNISKADKENAINSITVTTLTGKRIYADPISRLDLSDVIMEAMEANIPDDYLINWKTADGIKEVTISELKEARKLGLEAKANIIGVN